MLRRTGPALLIVLAAGAAAAQSPLPHHYLALDVDSGVERNSGTERTTLFVDTVQVEGAEWLRLYFSGTVLGAAPAPGGVETVLRLTSLEDGAVQHLTGKQLEQWRYSSAFFNGDAVRVELIADPGAGPSRVRIQEVMVGEPAAVPETICGPTDDRVESFDDRSARIVPVGCSVWLIDDAEGCFLTAGHCPAAGGFDVVEFDVPLSNPDGSLNHPPPDQQYPVDPASVQFQNGGIGNDWSYFGTHPNSETERTPVEIQGTTYVLGTPPSTPGGETLRITGYGTTDGVLAPLTLNQVQKTHTGPLSGVGTTSLQYGVDTTGGNSGSVILDETSGEAIGIHTHAGCTSGGGANNGTSLVQAGLQSALGVPLGVCADGPPPLRVLLASPIADPVPLAGTSFEVDVVDRDGLPAAIAAATLVYDAGEGDQTAPLSALGGATWEATLPAMTCGTEVLFRVDVEAVGGAVVRHPFSATNSADRRYRRWVSDGFDATFRDSFETDQGWTVEDDPGLTDGSWERAIPGGYGLRGDPPWDADGSGRCFVTDPSAGNTDVDGGATRLTSPTLDATGDDPHVSYWRWWDDAGASDDVFLVEVSDDDGASWTTLETVGPNVVGTWVRRSFRIADFVTPNDQFRIRFTAADGGAGNVIEAGVDGVAVYDSPTGLSCVLFIDGFESGDVSEWSSSVGF